MARRLKKQIRRIFILILWGVLFAGAGILLGFAGYEQNGKICRNMQINIFYGEADPLITENAVDTLIRMAVGGIKGKPLYMINTEKIERAVRQQAYVAGAHVYETHTGNIVVDVFQRYPIMRIITESGRSYYIGSKGALLPLNPVHPLRLLVASGAIADSIFSRFPMGIDIPRPDSSDSPLFSDLFKLALFIDKDPFLKAQADQIYVNRTGDYELIPKVGDNIILIGNAENLEDKFGRLMLFYRHGLNKIGWNKYQIINIKYKNQVVCSKY